MIIQPTKKKPSEDEIFEWIDEVSTPLGMHVTAIDRYSAEYYLGRDLTEEEWETLKESGKWKGLLVSPSVRQAIENKIWDALEGAGIIPTIEEEEGTTPEAPNEPAGPTGGFALPNWTGGQITYHITTTNTGNWWTNNAATNVPINTPAPEVHFVGDTVTEEDLTVPELVEEQGPTPPELPQWLADIVTGDQPTPEDSEEAIAPPPTPIADEGWDPMWDQYFGDPNLP